MHFLLKYAFADNLLVGVDHTRDQSAYGLSLEYAQNSEAYGNFGSYGIRLKTFSLETGIDERANSYFANASYQTPNLFDHVIFTANYGYDGYYEHKTLGLGVDINMKNSIPWLTFTEKLSFLAEYYPQIDTVEGISQEMDSFAAGIKFQTFGHHFEVLLTNASNMDPRTMALGSRNNDLHFGFNINRKF